MGRTARWTAAVVATGAVLLAAACSGEADPPDRMAADRGLEQLARLADDPAEALRLAQQVFDGGPTQVEVVPDGDPAAAYDLLLGSGDDGDDGGGGAWRADLPTEDGGTTTVLGTGEELCFDRGFRGRLRSALAESYGAVRFDPEPWTCTSADFGLNRLLVHGIVRDDPRARLAALETDRAIATVDADKSLLRVRAPGVTADGPLDPGRPPYDLFLAPTDDGGLLPVRLEGAGTTWVFERAGDSGDLDDPGDLQERLAAPTNSGSYGYAVGPGQGVAKACRQAGGCPDVPAPATRLTWGDGRR